MKAKQESRARRQPRIYRPDSRFDSTIFGALGALFLEIIEYRSHIATLFGSEFNASYRGTALGVAWNFLLPILPISVYVLLVHMRIFPAREGIPAAVYIGFNVTLWFLFTGLINRPIQIVRARNTEMMKTAMPLSAALVSSFARLCFDTLVRCAFVIVLILVLPTHVKLTALAVVPVIAAGSALFLGTGLLLSILNVTYPDVERIVTIVLQYGIFLSGVIFPISAMPPLRFLEVANPFAVFIHSARDAAFAGTFTHPLPLAVWTLAGGALLLLSARFFYVMEYRIRGLA